MFSLLKAPIKIFFKKGIIPNVWREQNKKKQQENLANWNLESRWTRPCTPSKTLSKSSVGKAKNKAVYYPPPPQELAVPVSTESEVEEGQERTLAESLCEKQLKSQIPTKEVYEMPPPHSRRKVAYPFSKGNKLESPGLLYMAERNESWRLLSEGTQPIVDTQMPTTLFPLFPIRLPTSTLQAAIFLGIGLSEMI